MPQGAVAISQAAAGEVLCRRGSQLQARVRAGLPPVELLHALRRHAHAEQPGLDSERHEVALDPLRQVLDRRYVKVIVVIVRKDHAFDRRQLLERQRRRVKALGAREAERRHPFAENRIDEPELALKLE